MSMTQKELKTITDILSEKDKRIEELEALVNLAEPLIDLMTDTRHPNHIKYYEKFNIYKEKYGR